MTNEEMLTIVKSMSGEESDAVASAFVSMAGQAIINRMFPFVPESELSGVTVPGRYQMLQCEIAVYLLNKRGAEGQTGHNENGINRSYENGGIPRSMLNQVTPYCRIPGGASHESTEP